MLCQDRFESDQAKHRRKQLHRKSVQAGVGRLRLQELADRMGGLDYTAAGAAVSRFRRRLVKDRKVARLLARMESQLSNVEI